MDSLVGYGSDDDVESERFGSQQASAPGAARRREDDTNYDDVNMDMSEESQEAESEPELPPAEAAPAPKTSREDRRESADGGRARARDSPARGRDSPPRGRDSPPRGRDSPPRGRDSPPRDRDSPPRGREGERRRRASPPRTRPDRPRRDDRQRSERGDKADRAERAEKDRRGYEGNGRRGLLGDRPDDRSNDSRPPPPALMELRPFGASPPTTFDPKRAQDTRDAVSPRFVDRERRDRDRDRERDRDRHNRRSEEKRSHRHGEARSRSRSRGAPPPAPHHSSASSSNERRGSPPSGDYRHSSYKVNRKLDAMEKMGLQIKTPDGSMATAQQLRAAACDAVPGAAPPYYCAGAQAHRIMDQVQKRKLLWAHKGKSEAEEAAKWSGTRFAQDNDGRQVSKFMRLMGIKEPAAINSECTDKAVDPIKKQEELFQAMQAQYEVARATTHTMRGVGLGFQRGQF